MKMSKRYAKTHFFVGKLNKTDPAKRVEGACGLATASRSTPWHYCLVTGGSLNKVSHFCCDVIQKGTKKPPTRPGNRVLRAQL